MWNEAHAVLVAALQAARDAGITEDEALSALDDVYHEDDSSYVPGPPKAPLNNEN